MEYVCEEELCLEEVEKRSEVAATAVEDEELLTKGGKDQLVESRVQKGQLVQY